MRHLDLADPGRYSDVVWVQGGFPVIIRFVGIGDATPLQSYFQRLSARSRYNRLMGAASGLPSGQLDRFVHIGEADGFSLVATIGQGGDEEIIGEARYAVDDDSDSVEIALSVDDALQGRGLGAALLSNLQCRAAALGASRLFGDTLRSNDAMLGLALKQGFRLARTPGDWKQVRFEKDLVGAWHLPCASARTAAMQASAIAG